MKKKSLTIIALTLFFLTIQEASSSSIETKAEEYLQKLTLPEKVGELFMVGFRETKMSQATSAHFKKYPFQNFILFSHNINDSLQTKQLLIDLKKLSPHPLFFSTDQEGGDIIRIKEKEFRTPSAMALGATKDSKLVYQTALHLGHKMKELGFNLNLAPVLDINSNANDSVMGNRSFGGTPEIVSQMGKEFIRGLQESGISATAKHFPGHGNSLGDSHEGVSRLPYSFDKLKNIDLIPFKEAIKNDVDIIMTAHVTFPGEELPVTLSPKYLQTLLRQELGFKGIILSDDLEMAAILKRYGIKKGVEMSFLAGSDMIMVTGKKSTQIEAFNSILNAVQEKRISEERLNESVKRILTIKFKRQEQSEKTSRLPSSDMNREIAQKAFTIIHKKANQKDLLGSHKKILVLTTHYGFFRETKKSFPQSTFKYLKQFPTRAEENRLLSELERTSKNFDVIIVGFNRNTHAKIVEKMTEKLKTPIISISFSTPYFEYKYDKTALFVCIYDHNVEALQTVVAYLRGEYSPTTLSCLSHTPCN